MNTVKIDVQKMPRIEVKLLCRTLLESAEAFYRDPANMAEFEAWKKARQEAEADG